MNTVYLTQAEPLLRGAHTATINQKDRDALRLIHCALLRFMRGQGIFMGEIPPDKASKTSAPSDPLTPDPACNHCHGTGVGIGSVFDRCICTYGNQSEAKPERRVIMDEDDAREKDMREKLFTLQSENDAWRVDSQMLADICNLLTDAMPGFVGTASTPEWTVAAVRELLEQWTHLVEVLDEITKRHAKLETLYFQKTGTKDTPESSGSITRARHILAKANQTSRGQS